ncbi:MAG: DUF2723 domain-containing protein [Caldilineaceae bacterium]|nr:DUF2723 domain-containing protein [Caldilineaceae bacterium]
MKKSVWDAGGGWLVGLAALLLYALTAAPGIVELFDDSLEFQLVAPTFAIAHPTGYPLYTLLGGLWSRVVFPFGNWAWRMNLFSALAGAGTIALLYLLGRRLTGGNPWGGLAAAAVFALSPVWWSQTTVAEVYALHNLFVVAILYTAISLGKQPSNRQVTLLCGLAGLSLTHHRTAVLLLPGLALYLLWTQPRLRRPQVRWLGWIGAFLLPLLLYLYIPLRAARGAVDLQGDYANTWAGFWRHVLASGYTGFFSANPLAVARTPADWLALAVSQFGWLFLGLAVIGLGAGVVRSARRAEWGLVWLTLAANLLFALNYRVADVEVFWLPVFLCLALGAGNGMGLLMSQLPPLRWSIDMREWRQWVVVLFLVIPLGFSSAIGHGPPVNRSDDWAAHNYALALASVDFPPNSRVVGLRGQTTALQFMQASAGMAPNAQAVPLDNPDERRAFVEQSVAAGLPVYLTQEVAGIEYAYSFSGEGVLVRVWPRGESQAGTPTHATELALADGQLQLTGYDLDVLDQPGDPALRVVLYWRPTVQLSQRLKLSLRLLSSSGEVLRAEDRYPLRQVAATLAWLPGEIVQDAYDLPRPPGSVELLVIVYDEATVAEVGRMSLPIPQNLP